MEYDSKIIAITGLTYTMFGLINLVTPPFSFILPEFLIVFLIPILCVVFFITNWKTLGGLFFIFFPLLFVQVFLEIIWGESYVWLGYFSFFAPLIMVYLTILEKALWKNLIWIPLTVAALLFLSISLFLFIPELLYIGLFFMFVFSILALLLNRKQYALPSYMKQHFLILALSCYLLSLAIISDWII